MERLIDPTIADLQHEYDAAASRGLVWRGRYIYTVGSIAISRLIAASAAGASTRAMRDWARADGRAVGRTAGFSSITVVVMATLLVWPALSRYARVLPADKVAWMIVCLVPSALLIAIPLGLMCGILSGLRGRLATRSVGRSVMALAIACSIATLALSAWTMPAANQAFRELIAGRHLTRGLNELTLRELSSSDLAQIRRLVTAETTDGFAFAFHSRLALAFAPLVLGLFSLGVANGGRNGRGRLTTGVAALTLSFAYYLLLYGARAEFIAGWLPPVAAGWGPNLAVLVVTLLLFRWPLAAETLEVHR
jgi:lipopolysaccharide export LptBFGC system permease protein LptF